MAARGRNVAAFERTVAALRATGRIEAVDAALVAAGRSLAALMDDPEEVTASVVWPYLRVVAELRGAVSNADDGIGDLVAALSAPMGDAPES